MSENTSEEVQTLELEVAPIESITKAEVNQQIATAHQYPRSMAQFFKRVEAMVTSDQETAESCIYRLRRKDKQSPGGYKIIEGESIRMAEMVAAAYGNLRSAVHIVGHTPTRVSVRAVCHDLETNNLIAVEKQAKTAYSDGSPYNEDMAITTANALVSKALRDAIFRVVPKALVKSIKEKAKLVAFGNGATFIARRAKALEWFKAKGAKLDRVFLALEVKGEEDMTVEHLEILTGLKTAIVEGDQTIDEAFPGEVTDAGPFERPAENPKKSAGTAKDAAAAAEKKPETAPVAQKEAQKPKETVKTEPKPVATPVVQKPAPVQTPAPEPQPDEPPTQTVDERAEAEAGLAPETKPAPKTTVAVEQTFALGGDEPKGEPTAPAAPTEIGAAQANLQKLVEEGGATFLEFVTLLKNRMLLKDPVPKNWAEFDQKQAEQYTKSIKGILVAVKAMKAAPKK